MFVKRRVFEPFVLAVTILLMMSISLEKLFPSATVHVYAQASNQNGDDRPKGSKL
jgi:hypothetical protein